MSEKSLLSGLHCFVMRIPAGDVVNNDGGDLCLTVQNSEVGIRWSLKFFENLHMDLSTSTRDHLHKEIERIGRAIFREKSNRNIVPEIEPMDPNWSPIIELEYQSVPTRDGGQNPALLVVHEAERVLGEHTVMGRFFLPVRDGLFEVIAIADSRGSGTLGTSAIIPDDDEAMDTDTHVPSHTYAQAGHGPAADCLDRIREAMTWLLTESQLVVTDPFEETNMSGKEVELRQLRCKLVLPPRFVYSPNPSSPESNKHRFCRASFGGSDGVQAMVVSCWYGRNIGKGMKWLRQIALYGSRVIHESQQFSNIRITTKEVRLTRRRWLMGGNRDAVLTTVNCEEGYGIRRQNTVGWVREANSGIIFLVYFIDTLGLDSETVEQEVLETLASIRVPRLHPRQYAWNIQSMILSESVRRRGMLTGTHNPQRV